jgi:alpha-N-arabinofuranosidase
MRLESAKILRSDRIQDHNSFDDPEKIIPRKFLQAVMKEGDLQVDMPPASVVLLTLHE